jgi:hypothetical protein
MVVETLPGETLVYDLERNCVHSLRPLAAALWPLCDGATGPVGLAVAARGLGLDADADLAELALDELARAGLVLDWPPESRPASVSRRTLLKRAALVVGVVTMAAPEIAEGS